MREVDEKKYWKEMFQWGKYLLENEGAEAMFQSGIQMYSKFLGDIDGTYLYNDTFLPLFTEKFFCFIKFFYKKYPFIMELIPVCKDKKGMELIIDDYWKIEGRTKGNKCFVFENSSYDSVCRDTLEVKAVLLNETRRFVWYGSIKLTEDSEEDNKELSELKRKLEKFIEIHMGKSEHEQYECTEQ